MMQAGPTGRRKAPVNDTAKPLPAQTRVRLAACAAVGLSYWSGHPQAGCLWAVDDHQQAHVVKVDYKGGQAWRAVARSPWATGADWQAPRGPGAPFGDDDGQQVAA